MVFSLEAYYVQSGGLKMRVMRAFVLLCGLVLPLGSLAFGADIYISQNTSGSNTGTDCADAHSAVWFNANSAGGNTYHLCGTFTGTAGSTMLTPNSGSAGNVVSILFESGAVLTAPYWGGVSTGAITISGKSYITIDGGANGIIQNTADGTALANQQASQGIFLSSASNIEIKNLTIQNIYANGGSDPNASDTGGQTTADIYVIVPTSSTTSNLSIHNNKLKNARSGVRIDWDGATLTNVQIYNNYISDHCWGIIVGAGGGADSSSSLAFHDNEITDWWNWQCPSLGGICTSGTDLYHTDGFIVFQPLSNANAFAPLIYNNYIHGDLGQGSATAFIFCTNGGGSGSVSNVECQIFNNLLVQVKDPRRTLTTGPWILSTGTQTGPMLIANNTLVGWGGNANVGMELSSIGDTIENNIIENVGHAVETYITPDPTEAVTGWTKNYNVWYNISPGAPAQWAANQQNGHFYSYATWQGAGYGYDANSLTTDPLLNSSYYISSVSSSAYHLGTNLTSLRITALDSDKAGVARPASGAWDAGAFQFVGQPAPPTNLTATPQ